MKITGIKPNGGISDLQMLYSMLQNIYLYVGHVPQDCEAEIDISGIVEYAKETHQALCDLTDAEKEKFVSINRGGLPVEIFD